MMFGFDKQHTKPRPSRLGARFARLGKTAGATCLLGLATLTTAQAGIVVNLYEDGGIKGDFSGFLNLGDATGSSGNSGSAGFFANPGYPGIYWRSPSVTAGNYDFQFYSNFFANGPSNFGTGGYTGGLGDPTMDTQLFALDKNNLFLSSDYESGTEISGSFTASNTSTTLSGIGAAEGTYLWYNGELTEGEASAGEFVKLIVTHGPKPASSGDSNSVPAPATPLLIAAGILGGGLSRRLRRTFA